MKPIFFFSLTLIFCIQIQLKVQTPVTDNNFNLNGAGSLSIDDDHSYIFKANDYMKLLPSAISGYPDFKFSAQDNREKFTSKIKDNTINTNSVSTPYNNIFQPNTRPLQASKKVGTIQGSYSVSETGNFNYSIQINIPPGTNGVQPTISINYSSINGKGILGEGWSIGGLSAVSRVAKTTYFDGINEPVGKKFSVSVMSS